MKSLLHLIRRMEKSEEILYYHSVFLQNKKSIGVLRMFKKLLISAAILATSSTGFASVTSAPALYLGGSVGLINNSSETGWTSNYRGFDGNIFLGYGGVITPNISLAGEAFFVPGSFSVGGTGSTTLKTNWGVGASILPGVLLNDKTMAYLRLGFIDSEFNSPSASKFGGQLGLGLQTNLCQNWEIRGEYTYSRYGSPASYISSPTTDGAHVGIVYRFG